MVSGYGFGKTETKLIALFMDMQRYGKYKPVFALYDPTYDLLDLNTTPRLIERLEQFGIWHNHNKQKKIIHTSCGKIILRSMDTPSRIVAYECFRSYIDELETLRPKQIEDVWKKILGRNRQKLEGCEEARNRTYTFTTPDAGFGFTYKKWGKAENKESYKYVVASTRDNPYLPDDYVSNLEADYPANVVKAFVDGHWTNILSGVVYTEFDRTSCHGTIDIGESDDLHIGQDFNVGGCVSVVGVEHKGVLYIVDEFISIKTFDIKDNYDSRHKNKAKIYPDATGVKKTSNAAKSDIDILEGGFSVVASKANPRVSDRVMTLNVAFKTGKLKVDVDKCPNLTEALEQQAYTESGDPEKSNEPASIDDYNDSLGYLNFKLNPITKPLTNVNIKFAM